MFGFCYTRKRKFIERRTGGYHHGVAPPFLSMTHKEALDQIADEVYHFIVQYIQKNGFAPNLREIGEGCHIGRSTTIRYLDRLELQRRITREPGRARSISLLSSK